MSKAIFPSFKFLSLDYVYENITTQKLSMSWMLIPFPKEILKEDTYCHSKIFVEDSYRRPWVRAIPACKIQEDNTESWNKCPLSYDFLEKMDKPLTMIPSSNPGSPVDLEEVRSDIESCAVKELPTDECWTPIPFTTLDYFLPEEVVFVDTLAQFRQHIPSLSTLISRLKPIPVQDPLPDWNRFLSSKSTTFRIETAKDKNLETNASLEEFHMLPLNREKLLSLPCTPVDGCDGISKMPDISTVLNLASEELLETSPRAISPPEMDIIEKHMRKANLNLNVYENIPDKVFYRSHSNAELEVPLIPLIPAPKSIELDQCINLKEEALSPFSSDFHVTDKPIDVLEFPACRNIQNLQFPCLEVPRISVNSPHHTTKQLKEQLCMELDKSVDYTLENNWWQNLGLNVMYNQTENRDHDMSATLCPAPERMELSTKISLAQPEGGRKEQQVLAKHSYGVWAHGIKSSQAHKQLPHSQVSNLFGMRHRDTCAPLAGEQNDEKEFQMNELSPSWSNKDRQKNRECSNQELLSREMYNNHIHLRDTSRQVYTNHITLVEDKMSTQPTQYDSWKDVSCPSLQRQINVTCDIGLHDAERPSATQKNRRQQHQLPPLPQEMNEKTLSSAQPLSVYTNYTNLKDTSREHTVSTSEAKKLENINADPLSTFIALRMKWLLGQSEEEKTTDLSAQENRSLKQHGNNSLNNEDTTSEKQPEDRRHKTIAINFTASDSQCQACDVLQLHAKPVLKKLKDLGASACSNWTFATVTFDCTRFFLCQQENLVSDNYKMGKKNNNQMMLFRNASFLHILVTIRDLILMCTLNEALDYLCKAKDFYKSALGSWLDGLWRNVRIIQYIRDNTKEMDPKITALMQWMEETRIDPNVSKILVLTRMDLEVIQKTFNNALEKTKGLRVIGLSPGNGSAVLDPKCVLESLRKYSCTIVNNQYIGSDFPWTHFSFVIEYDCTDFWLKVCQDFNVPHIRLQASLPHSYINETAKSCGKELLRHLQIPYVFLSSDGLTKNSEMLHVLESRYNMVFIEREHQPVRKSSHCAVITVDESTVIILQTLEALMADKSAENLILRLVALSMQYSCCWILLYARKGPHSEYNLSGDMLHNVALLYSAIIPYVSKSEDIQIKTFISAGTDETGLLIKRIADYTLMLTPSDPYKWLDKSWLSLQPTQAEKVLLSFPCINPMVAQRMLSRGLSLQQLLSADSKQLQEHFPEVPLNVLKHFTSITTMHKLKADTASQKPLDIPVPAASEDLCSHENVNSDRFLTPKSSHQSMINNSQTTTENYTNRRQIQPFCKLPIIQDSQIDSPHEQPVRFTHKFFSNSASLRMSKPQNTTAMSNNIFSHLQQSTNITEYFTGSVFSSQENVFLHSMSLQSQHCYNTENQPIFSINRECFFADLPCSQNSIHLMYCSNELITADIGSQPSSVEKPRVFPNQGPGPNPNHIFSGTSTQDFNQRHSQMATAEKRRFTINKVQIKDNTSGMHLIQASEHKRRKLMYERVPGRSDGQTRLKFF